MYSCQLLVFAAVYLAGTPSMLFSCRRCCRVFTQHWQRQYHRGGLARDARGSFQHTPCYTETLIRPPACCVTAGRTATSLPTAPCSARFASKSSNLTTSPPRFQFCNMPQRNGATKLSSLCGARTDTKVVRLQPSRPPCWCQHSGFSRQPPPSW